MGCCYSSENEDSDQDREERKLLLDPSSPPTKVVNGAESNNYSLPSARTDEQALLSSILAKTASNIIDVSAADSQGMEQQPDPLEEAAATAISHQPAPPSSGQRAHPLLRLAAGLQDSCLCLQCTFSDPCGCKRGAGCTVWDPVKTGILGRLFFSSSPCLVSTQPPLAPSLAAAYTVP
ncbi:late endosomal/lysosomal adaptor, MAPK and MTOR activator 1 [Phyllostomus discolor]|uniref:Ragulator complex protein LAMTOR1 n=1 Tax=Phyllostomus discolor TaxID=89673 RepID=A0A833ZWR5_9CHIR|nr:late endosomal/lysosomal adaptor, MAPK and MTOR activator 1 [Phyllostomus discolor]